VLRRQPLWPGQRRSSVDQFAKRLSGRALDEQDGQDDNRPALIRITEVRDGDLLTAIKPVQPPSGKGGCSSETEQNWCAKAGSEP
jgi:hypothetical protein